MMRGFLAVSMVVLMACPAALAGTALFSGSANDTEAQLQGAWVNYQAESIDNNYETALDYSLTTNLTTLCGARSLNDLGTITMVITEPQWNWTDWYGSWTELEFFSGEEMVLAIGIAPPYTWGGMENNWLYVAFGSAQGPSDEQGFDYAAFGVTPECVAPMDDAAPCLDGHRPLGWRLTSDGTNISLEATTDGTTFFALPQATWPINNLPLGRGDLTDVELTAEIMVMCNAAPIEYFQWNAPTVPWLNNAAGLSQCAADNWADMLADWDAEDYIDPLDFCDSGPDHNWDGLNDPFQLALLSAAMCVDPAIEAAYLDNIEIGLDLVAADPDSWGFQPSFATLVAGYATMGNLDSCDWGLWLAYVTGWNTWRDQLVVPSNAADLFPATGDYDADGLENRVEWGLINRAVWPACVDIDEFVADATTADDLEGADLKLAYLNAMFGYQRGEWGPVLPATGDMPDHQWNNIPDNYEIALLAVGMAENPAIQAVFDANLAVALDADHYEGADPFPYGLPEVAAAYATMGQEGIDGAIQWMLWISMTGFVPYDTAAKTATEPLSALGDYDGDGFTNEEEYEFVAGNSGTPEDYAVAASGGPGGPVPVVPVAGLVGLGLLAGACLLAGASTLRKK